MIHDARARVKSLGVLTVVLLLAACSTARGRPQAWTKPDVDFRQLTIDEYVCDRQASETSRTPDLIVGGLVDLGRYLVEDLREEVGYQTCMTRLGYARTRSGA